MLQRKMKQQGFTLLELLVVVAIMAFLVAMVAPRFAGVTGGTVDVTCDSNQQRMVAALSAYNEQTGALPSGMVNLVDRAGTAADPVFHVPTHTGRLTLPDEGQATFFEEFFNRNQFQVHRLNAAEASALRGLGIGSVHNLNAFNYEGVTGAAVTPTAGVRASDPLARAAVSEGLGVLMVGMGSADATVAPAGPAAVTAAGILQVGGANFTGWGNPDWFGRIILGVGPDSDLIKKGMITAAGLCPGGIGNAQVFWNNYSVLLPRLQATIDRFPAALMTGMLGKSNGGSYRAFDLAEAQAGFMFVTQCPEGHRWPTADGFERWGVWAAANINHADANPATPHADLLALEVN